MAGSAAFSALGGGDSITAMNRFGLADGSTTSARPAAPWCSSSAASRCRSSRRSRARPRASADREAAWTTVKLSIPYGDVELPFELPAANLLAVVSPGGGCGEEQAPAAGAHGAEEQAEIGRALAEPIGAPRLSELAATATSAVIVVSDVTAPALPTSSCRRCSPSSRRSRRSASPSSSLSAATAGTRRRSRSSSSAPRSWPRRAPARPRRRRCVPVGRLAGTRLEVFRPYLEADLRICTGNIEYHYFAGFSGGARRWCPASARRRDPRQPQHDARAHRARRRPRGQPGARRHRRGRRPHRRGLHLQRRARRAETHRPRRGRPLPRGYREGVRVYHERSDLQVEPPPTW